MRKDSFSLKLAHNLKESHDVDSIRKAVKAFERKIEDLDTFSREVDLKIRKDLVTEGQLNTYIDLLKRDLHSLMSAQFELFEKKVEKELESKISMDETKKLLLNKMDISDYKNEAAKVKNRLNQLEIGGGSTHSRGVSTLTLQQIVRTELDSKADKTAVEGLEKKINEDVMDGLYTRINNLESKLFQALNSGSYQDMDHESEESKHERNNGNVLLNVGDARSASIHSLHRLKGYMNQDSFHRPVNQNMSYQERNNSEDRHQKELIRKDILNRLKLKTDEIQLGQKRVNELIDDRLKVLTAQMCEMETAMKKKNGGLFDDLQSQLIDSKIENGQREIMNKMTLFVEKLDEDRKQKSAEMVNMNSDLKNLTGQLQLIQEKMKKNNEARKVEDKQLQQEKLQNNQKLSSLSSALDKLQNGVQDQMSFLSNELDVLKKPIWDQLQVLTRENESLSRELARNQELYRKMYAEFQKQVQDKKSIAMIEFMNESTRVQNKLELQRELNKKKTSKLPMINFENQILKLKSISQQASPRSVSEISNLTKALNEVKRIDNVQEHMSKSIDRGGDLSSPLLSIGNSKQMLQIQRDQSSKFQFQTIAQSHEKKPSFELTTFKQSRSPFNLLRDVDNSIINLQNYSSSNQS